MSCFHLSGQSEDASETAPNAAARCAQQAVKLLSEFLTGYSKLTPAKADTVGNAAPFYQDPKRPGPSCSPVTKGSGLPVRQTAQRPKAIDGPADQGGSNLQSSSVQHIPAASSTFFPEDTWTRLPSAGSTVTAPCTAMWSQACVELFPQVSQPRWYP